MPSNGTCQAPSSVGRSAPAHDGLARNVAAQHADMRSSVAALKRELAADSLFMGEVRRQRKVQTANARDVKAKRAIAFLEQQESDFKSGGQGGMNPHKKKKK